jgi:SAM-dependent methyltransferase
MAALRKPLQGLWNVVRFNWHFYLIALALALSLTGAAFAAPFAARGFVGLLAGLLLVPVLASLAVSAYIYDFSGLYRLAWLPATLPANATLLTINAGFDEVSALLQEKYSPYHLIAVDFYNPARHTEVSIRRARRAYPPFPGTRPVDTRSPLPLPSGSVELAIAFLATHEIRDATERAAFFAEIRRVICPGGRVIVTEHLRDPANFLAYTIGFLHFHSRHAWLTTFGTAGLRVEQEIRLTPFVTAFVLSHHESTA